MTRATDLRKAITLDRSIDFEFFVREYRGGEIWVCARYGTPERAAILMARLRALGYAPVMEGKPGTAGQHIIEIKPDAPENNPRLSPYLRSFEDRVPRASRRYFETLMESGDNDYFCSRTRASNARP